MLPRNGRYGLLQVLLILALLVQTVAAASLPVQQPCGDAAAVGQASDLTGAGSPGVPASLDDTADQHCCCDDGLSCNPVDGCMQHCGFSLTAAFRPAGEGLNPAMHAVPGRVPALYPCDYSGGEFRPPRNTA